MATHARQRSKDPRQFHYHTISTATAASKATAAAASKATPVAASTAVAAAILKTKATG